MAQQAEKVKKKRRSPKKNARTKARNEARRRWREEHPGVTGVKLNRWPLPEIGVETA